MANRHGGFEANYQTRAPRTLCLKITSTGTTGAQTLSNTGPFNLGIFEVNNTTTGTYIIRPGGNKQQVDPYAFLSGVSFVADETDLYLDYYADDIQSKTDPTVTLYLSDNAVSAKDLSNTKIAWITLHFLDSLD